MLICNIRNTEAELNCSSVVAGFRIWPKLNARIFRIHTAKFNVALALNSKRQDADDMHGIGSSYRLN